MRAPAHHRRARALLRRPVLAVAAVFVWLLGVELGPGLHMARHGELGHHHHGASESRACASHENGVAVESHGHPVEDHDHLPASVEHHDHLPASVEHHDHEVETEPADRLTSVSTHLARAAHPADSFVHEPSAVPHGAGSLAHRDLVPLTTPLVLPPILSAPWRPFEVAQVLCLAPGDRTPETRRARGPPASGQPTLEPLDFV